MTIKPSVSATEGCQPQQCNDNQALSFSNRRLSTRAVQWQSSPQFQQQKAINQSSAMTIKSSVSATEGCQPEQCNDNQAFRFSNRRLSTRAVQWQSSPQFQQQKAVNLSSAMIIKSSVSARRKKLQIMGVHKVLLGHCKGEQNALHSYIPNIHISIIYLEHLQRFRNSQASKVRWFLNIENHHCCRFHELNYETADQGCCCFLPWWHSWAILAQKELVSEICPAHIKFFTVLTFLISLRYLGRVHKQSSNNYCIYMKGLCWVSVCWLLYNTLYVFFVFNVFWFLFCAPLYHLHLGQEYAGLPNPWYEHVHIICGGSIIWVSGVFPCILSAVLQCFFYGNVLWKALIASIAFAFHAFQSWQQYVLIRIWQESMTKNSWDWNTLNTHPILFLVL